MKRTVTLTGLAIAALAAGAFPAWATYHIMVVQQVFPGLETAPAAQYVMMQMQAPVQTLVFGQPVTVEDGSGTALPNFGEFCLRGPTGSRNDCSLPKVSPACSK